MTRRFSHDGKKIEFATKGKVHQSHIRSIFFFSFFFEKFAKLFSSLRGDRITPRDGRSDRRSTFRRQPREFATVPIQPHERTVGQASQRPRHRNLDLIRSKLRVLRYRSVRSLVLDAPRRLSRWISTVTPGRSAGKNVLSAALRCHRRHSVSDDCR